MKPAKGGLPKGRRVRCSSPSLATNYEAILWVGVLWWILAVDGYEILIGMAATIATRTIGHHRFVICRVQAKHFVNKFFDFFP